MKLKYALVERERRFLLEQLPDDQPEWVDAIDDRYITDTRLRLRRVRPMDSAEPTVYKLGQKLPLDDDPTGLACTSLYLDLHEYTLLAKLPAAILTKTRHHYDVHGWQVAVDEHVSPQSGLIVAEVDLGDGPDGFELPWPYVREVTDEEAFTGAALAGG